MTSLLGEAGRAPGVVQGARQAADHGVEGDAARGVRLRVEEDLRVAHVLGVGLGRVGRRQVVEVLLGTEHGHALVVDGEEAGQVVEVVRGPQRGLVGVRQLDAVALGERELETGLQGALDVQMQLALGQPGDERVDGRGHGVLNSWVL